MGSLFVVLTAFSIGAFGFLFSIWLDGRLGLAVFTTGIIIAFGCFFMGWIKISKAFWGFQRQHIDLFVPCLDEVA